MVDPKVEEEEDVPTTNALNLTIMRRKVISSKMIEDIRKKTGRAIKGKTIEGTIIMSIGIERKCLVGKSPLSMKLIMYFKLKTRRDR